MYYLRPRYTVCSSIPAQLSLQTFTVDASSSSRPFLVTNLTVFIFRSQKNVISNNGSKGNGPRLNNQQRASFDFYAGAERGKDIWGNGREIVMRGKTAPGSSDYCNFNIIMKKISRSSMISCTQIALVLVKTHSVPMWMDHNLCSGRVTAQQHKNIQVLMCSKTQKKPTPNGETNYGMHNFNVPAKHGWNSLEFCLAAFEMWTPQTTRPMKAVLDRWMDGQTDGRMDKGDPMCPQWRGHKTMILVKVVKAFAYFQTSQKASYNGTQKNITFTNDSLDPHIQHWSSRLQCFLQLSLSTIRLKAFQTVKPNVC